MKTIKDKRKDVETNIISYEIGLFFNDPSDNTHLNVTYSC